ncbi:MAG: hypothetical protein QM756_45170 [Polyangiaceae bacterium]
MSQRPLLRLAVATASAFVFGIGGMVAGIALAIHFELGDSLVGVAMGGGFLVGIALGLLGAARLTARWAPRALGVGSSGLDMQSIGAALRRPDAELPPQLADEVRNVSALAEAVRNQPKAKGRGATLLFGSLLLFLLAREPGQSMAQLALLGAVIAFHEAGHALGMMLFGYRDVRVFFVPFFGAATSGERDSAPGWQHGIVLLLGPVPGLLLAAALMAATQAEPNSHVAQATRTLVYLNAFNLLPVLPLDGGRLLELTVFGRHPLAEFLLRVASMLTLGLVAWGLHDWIAGAIAVFIGLGAGVNFQLARAALAWNRSGDDSTTRLGQISDVTVAAVHALLPEKLSGKQHELRAQLVRSVIQRGLAARLAPGAASGAALLLAWAASLVLAVALVALGPRS